MTELSRRELLVGAATVATVAALPAVATAAVETPVARLPAFVVGTDGEWDWQVVRALTSEDALRIYAEDNGRTQGENMCVGWRPGNDWDCPESGPCEHCGCEDVNAPCASLEVQRAKSFDDIENPSGADWIREGFGAICSRCGEETSGWDHDAVILEGDVVCCDGCLEDDERERIYGEY